MSYRLLEVCKVAVEGEDERRVSVGYAFLVTRSEKLERRVSVWLRVGKVKRELILHHYNNMNNNIPFSKKTFVVPTTPP